MNLNNAWRDAREEFEANTLPLLRKHGMDIGRAASNGDKKAQQIVECYTMLHRSFDPVTFFRLKDLLIQGEES